MTQSSAYPEKDVALLGNQVEIDVSLLPGVPNQRGPRGPQGLPGLDGVQPNEIIALVSYTHSQPAASNFWIITHNLKFKPNVTAFDSAGDIVEGTVIHNSVNQLTMQFSAPISGTAQLS
jgi:hypothetical protein